MDGQSAYKPLKGSLRDLRSLRVGQVPHIWHSVIHQTVYSSSCFPYVKSFTGFHIKNTVPYPRLVISAFPLSRIDHLDNFIRVKL